ncbi:MAG TPA: hypothetical protein VF170_16460 [Planctomycetaceae bacterium]
MATVQIGARDVRKAIRARAVGPIRADVAQPRPTPPSKYVVRKADGSPPDPDARYLVLRLDTDPFARKAAQTYADAVAAADPQLAQAIRRACAARVKKGWSLPATPKCECGGSCRPIAMEDFGRWSLEWECLDCCEPAEGPAIAWPFVEGFAEGADFERVGIGWDYA